MAERVLRLRQDELDYINLLLENADCCCGGEDPDCGACQLYVALCKKTGAVIPEVCVAK